MAGWALVGERRGQTWKTTTLTGQRRVVGPSFGSLSLMRCTDRVLSPLLSGQQGQPGHGSLPKVLSTPGTLLGGPGSLLDRLAVQRI